MALTDLTRISTSGIATGSTIDNAILRKDVSFRGSQVGVTSALFDSSNNALEFNDNVKIKLGNSGDLEIYHHTSNGSIINHFGNNHLVLRSGNRIDFRSANDDTYFARFVEDGSAEIYYDGNEKIRTTNEGALVTGILTATSFSGPTYNTSGIATFYDLRVSNNLTVEGTTTTLDTNLIDVDRVEIGANSNTDTAIVGIQSGTADIVNLFNGSTKVLTVDDAGNVGIGSATPASLLNLASSNPLIRLTDTDNGAHSTIGGESGNLYLYTNSTARDFIFRGTGEVARITGDGKLGIGSAIPSQKLDVNGISNFSGQLRVSDGSTSLPSVAAASDTDSGLYFAGANSLGLVSGGSRKLLVNSSGVTINNGDLAVNGGNLDVSEDIRHIDNTNTKISFTSNTISFDTTGSERLRINSDGQVVINRAAGAVRATSASKLEVFNDTYNTIYVSNSTAAINQEAGIMFAPANNTYGGQIVVKSDEDFSTSANRTAHMAFYTRHNGTAAERLRIQSTGIVKVETSDSSSFNAHLVVNNSESNSGVSLVGSGSSFSAGGWAAVTDAGIIRSSHNSSNGLVLQAASGDLRFYAGGNPPAERLRITSDGKILIAQSTSNWGTTSSNSVIQLKNSVVWDYAGIQFDVGHNYYYNSSGAYKYIRGGYAARQTFHNNTGDIAFWSGGTGSADATFTWSEILRIDSSGRVNIGQATDVDHTLCVAGTDNTTGLTGGHNQGIQLQNKSTTDDTYSQIEWRTSSGGRYARIAGIQKDANGNGGELTFLTENDAGTMAQRLLITKDATVSLGAVNGSSSSVLHIRSDNSTETTLELSTKSNYNGSLPDAKISFTQQNGTEIARIKCDTTTGAANMADLTFSTNFGGLEERLRITKNGNIGINSTSPQAQFVLSRSLSENHGIEMGYSSGNNLHFIQAYNRATSAFTKLIVNNSLSITSDGNIGIGGDQWAKLVVTSSSTNTSLTGHNYLASQAGMSIDNSPSTTGSFNAYTSRVKNAGGTQQSASLAFKSTSSGYSPEVHLTQRTGAGAQTSRLIITSDGQVHIGDSIASSGTGALNIKTSSSGTFFKFRSAADFDSNLEGTALDSRVSANTASKDLVVRSQNLVLWQGSNEKLRIASDGKVKIGSGTASLALLHIAPADYSLNLQNNSSNKSMILFSKNGTPNDARSWIEGNGELNGYLAFAAGDNERLRIDSSGRVQIASNAPANRSQYNNFDGPGRLNINNNQPDGTVDFTQGIVFTDQGAGNNTWTHGGIVCTGSTGYNGNLCFGTDGDGTENTTGITERLRITSAGNVVFKDKDSGHRGGGVYSRTLTVNDTGDSTTSFMRFQLDHGALAGMIILTGSNSGASVAKTYAFVAQYGQTVTTNLLADTGAYGSYNFSFTSSTINNQHNFMVQVSGGTQEVNMTVIMGCANQYIAYTEL